MSCPDLETLVVRASEGDEEALAHLESCEACAKLMDAHEALEHELFRLSDPFPPSGFVPGVMARIEAAPIPMRVELKTGFLILVAALALGLAAVLASPHGVAAELGTGTASAFVSWRDLLAGAFNALGVIWRTSAIPMLAVITALLMASLVGLRRLTGFGMTEPKVS